MAPSTTRVAVIIPVYNGARYLAAAIASVLDQTERPSTILVVDDGSTDESAAIARSFGSAVTLIPQEHRGQAAAVNAGLSRTTAECVAFLDADDLWLADKTARQLACFDRQPGLDYCVTGIQNFVSPEFADRASAVDPRLFDSAPGYVLSALMARRSVFDRLGGFDPAWKHANKTAWLLRARQAGAVSTAIADVLVRRRLHASNVSQAHATNSLDEYLRLVKQSLDRRRGAPA